MATVQPWQSDPSAVRRFAKLPEGTWQGAPEVSTMSKLPFQTPLLFSVSDHVRLDPPLMMPPEVRLVAITLVCAGNRSLIVICVLLKLLYTSARLTVAWPASPLIEPGMVMLSAAEGGVVS